MFHVQSSVPKKSLTILIREVIFSAELYGGSYSLKNVGPIGVQLKRNDCVH